MISSWLQVFGCDINSYVMSFVFAFSFQVEDLARLSLNDHIYVGLDDEKKIVSKAI